jgi:hypothetical protein
VVMLVERLFSSFNHDQLYAFITKPEYAECSLSGISQTQAVVHSNQSEPSSSCGHRIEKLD